MPKLKARSIRPNTGIAVSAKALVGVSGMCSISRTSAKLNANRQNATHTKTMKIFNGFCDGTTLQHTSVFSNRLLYTFTMLGHYS